MLDKINSVFFEEAAELLEQLEGHLLSLDENPNDKDIIAAVFRAMHTIKGSSGMFGFDEISKFTHEVENTFDMVRNGDAPVTKELISLTLKARDHIKLLLDFFWFPMMKTVKRMYMGCMHLLMLWPTIL